MRLRSRAVCLLLLIAAIAAEMPMAAQGGANVRRGHLRRSRERVPNRYLVVMADRATDPEAVALETASRRAGRVRYVYRQALRGFAIDLTEAAAVALASDPRVAYVAEDGVMTASTLSAQPSPANWGLDRIDQRLPTRDNTYRFSATGAGVNVYVLDSGIRVTHGDFAGRARGAYNAVFDGVPSDTDCYGHGTHVAGIVGGALSGVAKDASLYSVRVLGCDGRGTFATVIAGMEWVIANHAKPAVINLSINGSSDDAMNDAVSRAVAAGITVVASAGNYNSDACEYSPGAAAPALVVGNSTANDLRASDSNYGTCVDLFAPGSAISSAASWGDTAYQSMWGTSMSAPHVAGAAALYLERSPSALPAQVTSAILAGTTRGVVSNPGSGSPNLLLFVPHLGDRVAPTVALAAPGRDATLAGAVSLSAAAADDVELAKVSFYVDATLIGTDSSSPYTLTWNSGSISDGQHSFRADAQDRAGNVTRGIAVPVAIHNTVTAAANWSSTAVGAAGAGVAAYTSGGFSISAEGTDVWGTADSFHFVQRTWSGDGDLVAQVSSLTRPSDATFALAGLTFRQSTASDAPHVSLVVTTDGKLKLRRRLVWGGATLSDGPSAGSVYPPRWLKLSRRGNVFSGYYSSDGVTWTSVLGGQTIPIATSLQTGLLVARSGGTGSAEGTFRNVRLGLLPVGWLNADVGATGQPGSAAQAGGAMVLAAGGTDLWSAADAFHFVYRPWAGDGTFTTQLQGLARPAGAPSVIAALMVRESLAASARHASLLITSDGKAKFRRRLAPGAMTLSDGPSAGSVSVPRWLRVTRRGSAFAAAISQDGVVWQSVHVPEAVAMPSSVYVGFAAAANGATTLSGATFSPLQAQ